MLIVCFLKSTTILHVVLLNRLDDVLVVNVDSE